jgi:ubiquinone/menaquinone biosynthesis C-methylase UbiE
VKVTVHEGQAEKLPFPDRSFDTIVSTFTLCSVEDPGMVLSEVRRTLRASGQFLFLEHGLSPAPEVARWQRRLGPLQRRLVGGCHLTRDINEILAAAGFESVDRSSFYVAGISRAVGYMTAGRALAS